MRPCSRRAAGHDGRSLPRPLLLQVPRDLELGRRGQTEGLDGLDERIVVDGLAHVVRSDQGVPPRAVNWPYHAHSAQWEFYMLVSGRGQVRTPAGTVATRA